MRQPHAQIRTQGLFTRVTGMNHLQVIPSQLQAKFHGAGILLGAAGAAGAGVGTDRDQADDFRTHARCPYAASRWPALR